jgi:hypothetical protein
MPVKKNDIKNLWEDQLTSIFEEQKADGMEEFLSILSVIMNVKFDDNVARLYAEINDIEMFTRIINLFSGMKVEFPDRDNFKKATILALTYFYKEVKGLKWKDIKKEFPNDETFTMRVGKSVARLNDKIRLQLESLLTNLEKTEDKGGMDDGLFR